MENLIKNNNKNEQLVIYDNRINVSLQGLTKRDYDIFMVCAYKLKDMKNEEVEISYSELMITSQSRHYTISEFHKYLKEDENITSVRICYEDNEGNVEKAPIFKRFSANKQKKRLTLKVNDEFINFFSDLTNNFTTLDLVRYTGLKSKYSKILYQNLCQFRDKKTRAGFWIIPLEDDYSEKQPIGFKSIFDVPKGLINKRIKDDIINTAIKELKPYMQIKCNTILKGRKTIGYRFDFKEIEQKFLEEKKVNKPLQSDEEPTEDLFDKMIDLLDNAQLRIGTKSTMNCARKAVELNRDIPYMQDVINIVKSQNNENTAGKLMYLIVNGYDKPKQSKKSNGFNNFQQRDIDVNELEKMLLQRNL